MKLDQTSLEMGEIFVPDLVDFEWQSRQAQPIRLKMD